MADLDTTQDHRTRTLVDTAAYQPGAIAPDDATGYRDHAAVIGQTSAGPTRPVPADRRIREGEGAAGIFNAAAVAAGGVAADGAVGQRGRAAKAGQAAAETEGCAAGGVAADGGVGQRRTAAAADHSAACQAGGVAAAGAVGKRGGPDQVVHATAEDCRVAAHGGVGHHKIAVVEDAAAAGKAAKAVVFASRGVAAHGAVVQRKRAGIEHTATGVGGVAADAA